MIHPSFLPFGFFSFQTAFVTDEVTNIVKEVNGFFCYIYISIKKLSVKQRYKRVY